MAMANASRSPFRSGSDATTAWRATRPRHGGSVSASWPDTDEQIAELVGLVSLQLLTGAFNLVAGVTAGVGASR